MPIFEYICQTCHHHFETLVTGNRRPACPSCHGAELEKQLSVFAVSSGSSKPACESMSGGCGGGRCDNPMGPGACSMN
jgi:putative FmdB family regulatory protein